MDSVSISYTLSGTSDSGETVNRTYTGTIQCRGYTYGERDLDSTGWKLIDAETGDKPWAFALIINRGANDAEVRIQDTNGATYALVIPAGGIMPLNRRWGATQNSNTTWLLAYTGQTTSIQYFLFW